MAIVKTEGFDFQYGGPPDIRMQVASIAARNNINTVIRWQGMEVFVVETNQAFKLAGPVADNANWKEVPLGSGGRIQIVTFSESGEAPNNANGGEGDMFYRPVEGGTEVWQKASNDIWQNKGTITGGGSGSGMKMRITITGENDVTLNWSTPEPRIPLGTGVAPVSRFGIFGRFEIFQYGEQQYKAIQVTESSGDVVSYTLPLDGADSIIYIS